MQIEDSPDVDNEDTMLPGAVSADECLAPPGLVLPDGAGDMQECTTGTYKEVCHQQGPSSCILCIRHN